MIVVFVILSGMKLYDVIIVIIFLAGTFELDSILCVNQCPTNTMSVPSETGGEKCQDCDGLCPKGLVMRNTCNSV